MHHVGIPWDGQQQKSLFSNVKLISEHVTSVYPFLHGNIKAQLLGVTCAFAFPYFAGN